jgi:hypothetical protein
MLDANHTTDNVIFFDKFYIFEFWVAYANIFCPGLFLALRISHRFILYYYSNYNFEFDNYSQLL